MKKMKQALLFLLILPCLTYGQNELNKKESKLSINFQVGGVSSYMNLIKDFPWYHEIPYYGYSDDDLNSAPTLAFHSNISLNYHLRSRHRLGIGFEFSQMGENHNLGENKRDVLNYLGIIASHEFKLLDNERASIGIYNAFCFELPLYNDYGKHFLKGMSHIGGLVWRFKVNDQLGFSLNGIVKNALSTYNPIAWYNNNHRFGTGLLLGLTYKL